MNLSEELTEYLILHRNKSVQINENLCLKFKASLAGVSHGGRRGATVSCPPASVAADVFSCFRVKTESVFYAEVRAGCAIPFLQSGPLSSSSILH